MSGNKIKKAVIREDLLSITKDYRKAILLNQFIYWSERVSDADKFIEKENEIAKNNGETERELFYGWIYKTAEELADEVMLGLSASQIRRYINDLVNLGYLSKRNNPKYKWDRTLQYRVNLAKIAKDLKQNGYSLSDYKIDIPDDESAIVHGCAINTHECAINTHRCAINNEPMENQTKAGGRAIPDTTNRNYNTETTNIEITPETRGKNYKAFFEIPKKASEKSAPKAHSQNPSKLPYEYTQEQLENFLRPKLAELVNEIDSDQTPEQVSIVQDITLYFYQRYQEERGERHPILSNQAYHDVVHSILNPPMSMIEGDAVLNLDAYEKMIDLFFRTDYGKYSGNKTDYRISYFLQDMVRENLYFRAYYYGLP